MARPSKQTVSSGENGWDANVNANFQILFDGPCPIYRAANAAALPSASSYDDCIAITEDTHDIYISNGTAWVQKTKSIQNYSTSEQNTGRKWVTGEDIFWKTVDFGSLPNATTKTVAHGITNLGTIIAWEFVTDNGTNQNPMPFPSAQATRVDIKLQWNDTNIIVETMNDRTDHSGHCVIWYTKTS